MRENPMHLLHERDRSDTDIVDGFEKDFLFRLSFVGFIRRFIADEYAMWMNHLSIQSLRHTHVCTLGWVKETENSICSLRPDNEFW